MNRWAVTEACYHIDLTSYFLLNYLRMDAHYHFNHDSLGSFSVLSKLQDALVVPHAGPTSI